jgi:hypothetical protein
MLARRSGVEGTYQIDAVVRSGNKTKVGVREGVSYGNDDTIRREWS